MSADSSTSQYPRRVLVTGATGKQGRAVVDALLRYNAAAAPTVKYEVLALTRGTGESLAKLPNVTVVQGDLDDVKAIFSQEKVGKNLYGVFSVQIAFGSGASAKREIKQGKDLATEAAAAGVKHFVYTGVDRGEYSAPGVDLESPEAFCGIPHWDTKVHIERHIRALKLPYTFVRPPVFYDGWLDDSIAKYVGTFAKVSIRPHVKLQYIASEDIGGVVGAVFENPERFIGQAIGIAGDNLAFSDVDTAFKQVLNKPAPQTWSIVAYLVTGLLSVPRKTYRFFDQKGYRGDIELTKEIWPETKTFQEWLAAKSKAPTT